MFIHFLFSFSSGSVMLKKQQQQQQQQQQQPSTTPNLQNMLYGSQQKRPVPASTTATQGTNENGGTPNKNGSVKVNNKQDTSQQQQQQQQHQQQQQQHQHQHQHQQQQQLMNSNARRVQQHHKSSSPQSPSTQGRGHQRATAADKEFLSGRTTLVKRSKALSTLLSSSQLMHLCRWASVS